MKNEFTFRFAGAGFRPKTAAAMGWPRCRLTLSMFGCMQYRCFTEDCLFVGVVFMNNKKNDNNPKSRQERPKSWVDFRRSVSDVHQDHRRHPRLEFHCPARIQGIKGVFKVTDISMGGAFLEMEPTSAFELGKMFNLTMKLPTEYESITTKVKVANIRKRGVGMAFVNITPKNEQIIRFCFETFKDTVPLR
jgi:hypothetical protein